MSTVNLSIDKNELLSVIKKLDDQDKLMIYNELKKSLFLKRFNALLKSIKTSDLSMEEITKEVEAVRKKRYEQGKHTL